jgi:ABC-2 type transport system permease protein
MADSTAQARAVGLADQPLRPAAGDSGIVSGTTASLRGIWSYRELLALLVRRELKVRYKDSALGFLWSLLRPLALLLVYYVAIGKFLGAQRAIPDFAIFVFTGLTAWQLFSETVSGCTGSILGNAGLVKKVYLPREVFPLSTAGSALFNFGVQLLVLLAATVVTQRPSTGSRLLFVPLAIAVLLVYATAAGLVLAAVNVYLRDVQYLVEIALLVGFWTTPVVYSWELVMQTIGGNALVEQVYLANPVTAAVLAMQRAFWVAGTDTPAPDQLGTRLAVMLAVGVVLLWAAQRLFSRLEGNFAQEL